MPKVDPAHEEAVQKIARIFGLKGGGKSTWKSLSVEAAERKFEELEEVAESLIHTNPDGETCGCDGKVFPMFAAQYLHRFIEVYIAFGKDVPTSHPFNFVLFKLISRPYFGSFLRNRADAQPLLRHQISIILSHGLRLIPPPTMTSLCDVEHWRIETSALYKLSLYLRVMLYHFSKALDVSNALQPFAGASLLADRFERLLLPPLVERLQAGFKKREIIGAHPTQSSLERYTETIQRAQRRADDAIGKMKELIPLLRREAGVDARTLFKLVEIDDGVNHFPEDTCAVLWVGWESESESQSISCSDELRACSKCLSVVYCSEEHQRRHWKLHKERCFSTNWGAPAKGDVEG